MFDDNGISEIMVRNAETIIEMLEEDFNLLRSEPGFTKLKKEYYLFCHENRLYTTMYESIQQFYFSRFGEYSDF